MALEISAIDAIVGGIATAFFGGLLAAGAYLLQQHLALRERLATLESRLDAVRTIEESFKAYGDADLTATLAKRLKNRKDKEEP